ncbi:MAG: ArsR/SmtB family transcription factor [Mesorhizobium sp.]
MTDTLSLAFAALADPTRRGILAQLALGERTVNELVEGRGLSQPAISKHLKVLERAGLIERGRDAQKRPCRLAPEGLEVARRWIDRCRADWEGAFDRMDALLAAMPARADDGGDQR